MLRDASLKDSPNKKIAVIGQDHLRREVLKEKDKPSADNIGLILQTVNYAIDHGYHVILEGILTTENYSEMLKKLIDSVDRYYSYYFDVSLEETLRRHRSKPNAHEFGATQMRSWFKDRDLLGFGNEKIINEHQTQKETVNYILKTTGL